MTRMSMRNAEEEFSRRKAGLPSAAPKTPQEELTEALRDHVYTMHSYGPRKDSCWVMNLEWLNEVRRLDDRKGAFFFPPAPGPELLLGIPIKVRGDGGPPHLEPLEDHGE